MKKLDINLINDLAKGELVLANSGGEFTDLQLIIKTAFPKDRSTLSGHARYYYRSNCRAAAWDCSLGKPVDIRICTIDKFIINETDDVEKPNPELIKRLQNNELAITTDCNGTKEQLITILKAAFPEEKNIPTGNKLFYYKDNSYDTWMGIDHIRNGLKIYSIEEFFIKNTTMKDKRFPFNLSYISQHDILLEACPEWRMKLFEKWGESFLMQKSVEISEDFYKEMRAACTKKQHKLFDEIFGKDEVFPADGTACLVKNSRTGGWNLRYADGNGTFYQFGKKKGSVSHWKHWQILDVFNLPT